MGKLIRTHYGLLIILLIFVGLATTYSIIVPITQGEDELAHYRYIRFIAQTGRLPTTIAERELAWYRADWPPLYHLIVGAIVSPLDTNQPHLKDIGESAHRRLVGEIFYPRLIIYTADANWPWQDGILAWHIGRFISIGFATLALIITYITAYQLSSKLNIAIPKLQFALLATALLAFTPRYLFTSAMLGDDSLFILLSAFYIWLLLHMVWGDDRAWLYALSGIIMGLSIATKYSTGLIPFIILIVVWWRRRQANWSWLQTGGRVALNWGCTVIGTSWWFAWIGYHFNTIDEDGWLFGLLHPLLASGPDVSMRRIFAFFTGEIFSGQERPDAIEPGTFAEWWVYLFETFWGVPVLEYDPFFPILYILIFLFCVITAIGLWQLWRRSDGQIRITLTILFGVFGLLLPFPILRFFLTYNILETGQGRHLLYPAAQTVPILLTLGWTIMAMTIYRYNSTSEEEDTSRRRINMSPSISSSFLSYSLLLTPYTILLIWSLAQLGYMVNSYPDPLPIKTSTFDPASVPYSYDYQLTDSVRLLGYGLQRDPTRNVVDLTLIWQADEISHQNYRVQLKLVDLIDDQIALTWLSHPLNGLYPTRAWDKGDVIYDTIPLPLTTVPSGDYTLQLNLLPQADHQPILPESIALTDLDWVNLSSFALESMAVGELLDYRVWGDTEGARQRQTIAVEWEMNMAATVEWGLIDADNVWYPPAVVNDNLSLFIIGPHWRSGEYRLHLTAKLTETHTNPSLTLNTDPVLTVATEPRLFYLPPPTEPWIPVEANFANQVELIGYTLPTRRIEPGAGLPITLYWHSLAPLLGDYRVFNKLLDKNQIVHGGYDRLPREYYSTILWAENEVIEDGFAVPISPSAPPGIYHLHIGLYSLKTGEPVSLPLIQDEQSTETTSVVIGPIKVGGPPADVITTNPTPTITLNQSFGEAVTLLGYTLNPPRDNQLDLILYWQANGQLTQDYTTFLHLRDGDNQQVTGLDRPPANGGYPTSLWDVGDIIVDQITLPLTDIAEGQYTPVIGLYDPHTFQRLPVEGYPNGELPLPEVTLP